MWWQRRLWAAVAQSHRALTAILNGDPKGYEALFADREDVTLGNPFGPFASGRATVVKTLAGAREVSRRLSECRSGSEVCG